jgi:hypothetical protein
VDSRDVFALDSSTGSLLWRTSKAADVRHLLGVSGENLIASGRHLWWIDARTGQIRWRWPDTPHTGEIGRGRGVIAGSDVLWPTQQHIHTFDIQTMRPAREPLDWGVLGATPGNLLIAGDHLVVATADRLYAFRARAPAPDTITQRPYDADESASLRRPPNIATGVRTPVSDALP